MSPVPFRWNIARREQLGRLLDGDAAEDYPGFLDDLRECCVRVVALAGDARLIFVGRSPESIFDYLSAVFLQTPYTDRCALMNVSMTDRSVQEVERRNPRGFRALQRELNTIGLAPATIARNERPVVFVDLVYRARTFGNLAGLLAYWAVQSGVNTRLVRRRVRFLAVTERTKNSPSTWRWYQNVPWARDFPRRAFRSVSIPYRLWTYLGDAQRKVARSYPPDDWGNEEFERPPRNDENLRGLRLAAQIYDLGRQPAERQRFATELAACPEMANRWVRNMVSELRLKKRRTAIPEARTKWRSSMPNS